MSSEAKPIVSVIIVTRNTCELTRNAIASAMAGRGALAVEILVVDNGSTDDTATILPCEFPAIQLIRSETNLGFARACNTAARRAQGEFLLLLNSDARLDSDTLEISTAWMRVHPECAVLGAQLVFGDGKPQNSIANFPTLATELLNKSLLRLIWPDRFPGKEVQRKEPLEVESVIGAFFLTRRAVWEALGGLDERFFFFLEETDYCLRARQRGWRVMHLPQLKVQHDQGQTARQVSAAARIEYWRSRYAYFAKHYGPLTYVLLRIGLWLRLAVDWLVSALLTAASFGRNTRWRNKNKVQSALVRWHLHGCPAEMGLPR